MYGEDRNQEVDFERITALFTNTRIGITGGLVSVVFLGIAVYQFSSPTAAYVWVAAMILAYLPRILVTAQFGRKLARREITPANVAPWERYNLLSCLLPFTIYAGVIFLPYHEHTELAILYCACFVLMMLTGGSLSYGTSIGVLMTFLHINFFALIARCMWEGGWVLVPLGLGLVAAYVLIVRLSLRLNRSLVENISMKLDSKMQSFVDPLTNLWNRRRLDLFFEKLVPAARRSGAPFSVVMLDIDHFKRYNDQRGHNAGDGLLVQIGSILLECAREQDLVVRYGGEEFMLVLPSTGLAQARVVAERVIEEVRKQTEVTISAGLAEHSPDMDVDQLVQRADGALYEAKVAGRDTLRAASPG